MLFSMNKYSRSTLAAWIAALAVTISLPLSQARPDYANVNPDPDAWGVVPIPGFRLDRPYPGLSQNGSNSTQGTTAKWELDLRIKRNTPKTQQGNSPNSPAGANVTRVTVQLRPPAPGQPGGDLFDQETGDWAVNDTAVTGSWRVAMISFASGWLSQLHVVEGGNDDEKGACPTSVMSEQCAREMRAALASHPSVVAGSGPSFGFVPDSCPDYKSWGAQSVALNNRFNETTIYFDEVPEQELANAYDIWGSVTHSFVLVWGHSSSTAQGEKLSEDHVVIACVKIDSTASGVPMPNATIAQEYQEQNPTPTPPRPTGAGSTLAGSRPWWATGGVVAAALMAKEMVF